MKRGGGKIIHYIGVNHVVRSQDNLGEFLSIPFFSFNIYINLPTLQPSQDRGQLYQGFHALET